MYEPSIHPPDLWLEQDPLQHAEVDEVYRSNIERLIERGTITPPSRHFDGCRFLPPAERPEEAGWDAVKGLWEEPAEERAR